MSTIIRFKIIGCLKAQEEVLEIVKKKMEEVNSTNAPMPKVKYFIKILYDQKVSMGISIDYQNSGENFL